MARGGATCPGEAGGGLSRTRSSVVCARDVTYASAWSQGPGSQGRAEI